MWPGVERWLVRRLRFIQRLAAWKAYRCSRLRFCAMLISLIVAMLPWQVAAETTGVPLSSPPEQTTEGLRRGIINAKSKFRTSPSMQSEVIAIAKEGTRVEILLETERWLHVRSESGVEAWIYKSLVHIEPEPLKATSDTLVGIVQSDIMELLYVSAAKANISIESGLGSTPAPQDLDASSAPTIDEPRVPPETIETGWLIKVFPVKHPRPEVYVIVSLVIALVLSIALQLRGARQLRRATQEIGEILDIVEEMYADATSTLVNERSTTMPPMAVEASTQKILRPLSEFSPIEQAVLEALSDQCAVQEGELGKILHEKGYAGTLIKAIIGDIVRKTGTAELPWVEVSYAQGQYSYRLRPEAISNLSKQQAERR
jgi:hypothetical protein